MQILLKQIKLYMYIKRILRCIHDCNKHDNNKYFTDQTRVVVQTALKPQERGRHNPTNNMADGGVVVVAVGVIVAITIAIVLLLQLLLSSLFTR